MIRLERQRPIEVGPHVPSHALRPTEDQIDGDVTHALAPEEGHRTPARVRVVRPVHPLEHRGVERLHAQGDAGDPGRGPRPNRLGRDVVRIGLERYFEARCRAIGALGVEQVANQRPDVPWR